MVTSRLSEATEMTLEVIPGRSQKPVDPGTSRHVPGFVRPGVHYVEPVPSPAARQAERTGSVANVSVDETPWNTQNVVDSGTSSFVESLTHVQRGLVPGPGGANAGASPGSW